MSKRQSYAFSEFAKTQDEAVQYFLHHALDHMKASKLIADKSLLMDSAAYLSNLGFELLLKAMHLSESGKYKPAHQLETLHNGLQKKWITKSGMPLIKIIDRWGLVRYPIDDMLSKKKRLRFGGEMRAMGEIGTDELEKTYELFETVWIKLEKNKRYKDIIQSIERNPYHKGHRILMAKPKEKSKSEEK